MLGWHHWPDEHEFEQAPGLGNGQGSLSCCSPWGHKESDTTEWLNWQGGKKIKLIADLLLFSKTGDKFFSQTILWNVLKMKGVKLEMFHENVFLKWKPKILSGKQMLIHHQQTSKEINLEGNISGRRKIRPERNLSKKKTKNKQTNKKKTKKETWKM